MTLETHGERLRYAREEIREISRDELGVETGIRGSTIYKYEQKGMMPSGNALVKLARALGVSPDWIVTGDGNTPRSRRVAR